jgi:hypothetical protein
MDCDRLRENPGGRYGTCGETHSLCTKSNTHMRFWPLSSWDFLPMSATLRLK